MSRSIFKRKAEFSDASHQVITQRKPAKETTRPRRNSENAVTIPDIVHWRKGQQLGLGSFGVVYQCFNTTSGEIFVVKQIQQSQISKEEKEVLSVSHELQILSTLRHPNIVQYYGSCVEGSYLNIFFEFVAGGSIASLLAKYGAFKEPVNRKYTRQILTGLGYLHANNILHRDVKAANILVGRDGVVKLTDFGCSKCIEDVVSSTERSFSGSVNWMAPEVARQELYGPAVDIYSLGCTVIEMASGAPPWAEFDQIAILYQISVARQPPPIPESLSPSGVSFVQSCLSQDPSKRLPASELIHHDFCKRQERNQTKYTTMSMIGSRESSPISHERDGEYIDSERKERENEKRERERDRERREQSAESSDHSRSRSSTPSSACTSPRDEVLKTPSIDEKDEKSNNSILFFFRRKNAQSPVRGNKVTPSSPSSPCKSKKKIPPEDRKMKKKGSFIFSKKSRGKSSKNSSKDKNRSGDEKAGSMPENVEETSSHSDTLDDIFSNPFSIMRHESDA